MGGLDADWEAALQSLDGQSLRRRLAWVESGPGAVIEVDGGRLVNFGSNDYLALGGHPAVTEAGKRALDRFGAGSGASRLICGSLGPHRELEERLAQLEKASGALVFSSGYTAAMGVSSAVLDRDCVVILDKLSHACLVDAARLSGAVMRVFGHNDLEKLEALLRWSRRKFSPETRVFIFTESVFSMDGDTCPLRDIVALKDAYGACLLLDEAHAFGVLGPKGAGLAAASGLEDRVDIRMGTLSKAAGVSGGFLAGSRTLIDLLVNRARSFIFSTAPPPSVAAAASAAVGLIAGEEGERRRARLWENIGLLTEGLDLPPAQSAVVPWLTGSSQAALEASARLRGRGFFVPAIRYPTVARKQARLRISLRSDHTSEQVKALSAFLSILGFAGR